MKEDRSDDLWQQAQRITNPKKHVRTAGLPKSLILNLNYGFEAQ